MTLLDELDACAALPGTDDDCVFTRAAATLRAQAARIAGLEAALRGVLALHIAHHNHPSHAAARAALAPPPAP